MTDFKAPANSDFTLRFAVGSPDGPRSGIWRIWQSKNKSDVYVAARAIAGDLKLSLHESGQRHLAFTSEREKTERELGTWDRKSRFCEVWTSGVSIQGRAWWEYVLLFPTAQLRQMPLEKLPTDVHWLPPAKDETGARTIAIIQSDPKVRLFPDGWELFAHTILPNRKQLWLFHLEEVAPNFSIPAYAAQRELPRMRAAVEHTGRSIDGMRGILFSDRVFSSPNGDFRVPCALEWAGETFLELERDVDRQIEEHEKSAT